MWNDAALGAGRQIKWKYIIALLALAGACLWAAWLGAEGVELALTRLQGRGRTPVDWREFPCAPEDKTAPLSGGGAAVCLGGTVTVMDNGGGEAYSLETGEEDLCLTGDSAAAAYVPGGKTLYWMGEWGWREMTFPLGVYGAFPGEEDALAVLTTGSGYLTKIVFYDSAGKVTGEIGMTDRIMAAGGFCQEDRRFWALCISGEGRWSGEVYDMTGERLCSVPLENPRQILSCGTGAAVLTATELIFFTGDGLETGRYSLEGAPPSQWRCSETGWALLVWQRGRQTVMKTVSREGTLLGETVLDGPVRDVEVCGNVLYALDLQTLGVYDKQCSLLDSCGDGARAAGLTAFSGGCWLFGSGEVKQYLIS